MDSDLDLRQKLLIEPDAKPSPHSVKAPETLCSPEAQPGASASKAGQQSAQSTPGLFALSAQFISAAHPYNYISIDLISSLDQCITAQTGLSYSTKKLLKRDIKGTFDVILQFANFKLNLLIFLSSAIATLVSFFTNFIGDLILKYKFVYTKNSFWASSGVSLLAAWLTVYPCGQVPNTEGSGIPELKLIMTGTPYPGFFSERIFLVKLWGLVWGKVTGVGVGGFATIFHLSSCLTDMLFRMPAFRAIYSDHSWRIALLAAMSVPPNVIFYSPLGSIFFAVEQFGPTMKLYNVFRIAMAATTSYFFSVLLSVIFGIARMPRTELADYHSLDFPHFALMGVLCAFWVYFFLWICSKLILLKKRSTSPLFANRYVYCSVVIFLTIAVTYQHSFFATNLQKIMQDFFTVGDFAREKSYVHFWHTQSHSAFLLELFYLLVTRVVMLAGMSTLPFPGGIFGPGMIIGVTWGRLYGEFANHFLGCRTPPAAFAMSGGATFICCLTKTFSPMLFVVEFARNFDFILPNLIAFVSAFSMSTMLNIGIFEMQMAMRKLPYLVGMLPEDKLCQSVAGIARRPSLVISDDQPLLVLFDRLAKADLAEVQSAADDCVPFVSKRTGGILGYTTTAACLRFVQRRMEELNRSTKSPNVLAAKASYLLSFSAKHRLGENNAEQRALEASLRTLFGALLRESTEMSVMGTKSLGREEVELAGSPSVNDFQAMFDAEFRAIRRFFKQVRIGVHHPLLDFHENPVTVPAHMQLAKVQMLFLHLRVGVVWVQSPDERMFLYVSLNDFLKHKTG